MTRSGPPVPTTPRPGALEARFLTVVSHELRTPLTTIASFAESLDTDDLAPAERSVALQAVRRNTERMLHLVDDLMMVSRLQSGDLVLDVTRLDPAEVVREATELLAAQEPHTETILRATAGAVLHADRSLLRQLCYAVLGTVASSAADRCTTVGAVDGPDAWTLTVTARQSELLTDEGLMAGMLAGFEPPHRRRSTALWMLLAEAVAARHGGSVHLTFDPTSGGGAVIRLPHGPPTG